ncbi:MAG: GDP-mannose 4,6-dehydratase [Planctomycetota bacterium]|nr:GDP-mannose 4,6-dehydratase [Planctomycetota bacterium]
MGHVVITGGAGFIGSHLCDACLARGDRVTAVDNLITGSLDNIRHLEGRDDFAFVNRDISDGFGVTGRVDVVLHFASPASPLGYLRYPIQTMKVGGIGTHNALGLARAKEAKFLFASTSEVYGDPAVTPQPEDYWGNVNPVGPRGVYDEAKRFGEAITTAYRNVHGMDTQIVRLFNTYGPRMDIDDGRALPAFVKAALAGEPLSVHGDGQQTRSFSYVEDTVRGILTVLEHGDGTPVNVGRPGEITILEFAKLVIEIAGSNSEIVHQEAMEDDPKRREPLIDKARALGWEPQVPLRDGLERTIAWYRERLAATAPSNG